MDRGQGETIYEIGIGGTVPRLVTGSTNILPLPLGGCSSNGLSVDQLEASLATIQSLAVACQADMRLLRQKPAEEGVTAECLVRRKVDEDDFLEVR